jgi:uncharacterized membrane protein
MFHALQFWLGSLRLAALVRDTVWVKAVLESVHILANGLLLFSAIMICSRLAGFAGGTRALEPTLRRFSPWIWGSLAVAVFTGSILLTGAGRRGLDNPMFKVKLTMMMAAIAATAAIQALAVRTLASSTARWPQRLAAPIIGAACILLWLATVFAGRLLAYSSAFFPQD